MIWEFSSGTEEQQLEVLPDLQLCLKGCLFHSSHVLSFLLVFLILHTLTPFISSSHFHNSPLYLLSHVSFLCLLHHHLPTEKYTIPCQGSVTTQHCAAFRTIGNHSCILWYCPVCGLQENKHILFPLNLVFFRVWKVCEELNNQNQKRYITYHFNGH